MSFSGTKGYITKPKSGVMLNPLHPLSRGLVGYWLFNEGAGSRANDISGHGNHGTLTNIAPNVQGSGWGGSEFGGGLEFDGTDDYVDCGNDNSLNVTDVVTISAWIKFSVGGLDHIIFSKAGGDYLCVVDGKLDLRKGSTHYVSNDIINDNNWHFGAMVLNQVTDVLTLYVDGIESGTHDVSGSADITNAFSYIGSRDGSLYFDGSIGPVSIYEQAKSPAEIKQLYLDPFCNLLQVPIRRYFVGAIMNQFQGANIGADLYNGVFA